MFILKPDNLFRWGYSILLTLCLPVLFLRLLWRGRKNNLYYKRWAERLGVFTIPQNKQRGLWLHSVSVGESLAAIPLIKAFQKQYPEIPITVTCTTPNGSATIQKMLGDSVFHVYFPFDLPWAFSLFLKRLQPKICLIMETELWPNCLEQLKKREIPTLIINGRLSSKSMQGYQKILSVTMQMMNCITEVAAQSQMDGERFIRLGLSPQKLKVTGNIKFDLSVPEGITEKARQLKQQWQSNQQSKQKNRLVLIAGSTHAGEEEIILETFKDIRKKYPELFLILVPRHTERKESILNVIKQYNLSVTLRSQSDLMSLETDLLLVDTMGEMALFYACSDIAFVGGSFAAIGGHNTLEPAFASVPVIVGPHVHNFVEITDLLLKAGALKQVHNKEAFAEVLMEWLNNQEERHKAGMAGRKVVDENRGAISKVLTLISHYLVPVGSPS